MTAERIPIKERVARGDRIIGALSLLAEPALPEIVGASGYDFFIIDMEHAAIDGRDVTNMIRACQAGGVAPIVRPRHVEEKEILWLMDSGVEGLMLTGIHTAADARAAYTYSHYPPLGERGLCGGARSALHGARRGPRFNEYLEEANRNVLLIGIIESKTGMENLDAILAEPLDVIIVGRADLSISMGYGYAPGHPDIIRMSEDIIRRTLAAGKKASVMAYDVADAARWMECGCTVFLYGQPEMVLSNYYREANADLRAIKVGSQGRIAKAG